MPFAPGALRRDLGRRVVERLERKRPDGLAELCIGSDHDLHEGMSARDQRMDVLFVGDPERASAMGAKGREWAVREASPSAVGAAYEALLRAVCRPSAAG